MPRFTAHDILADQYTGAERLALDAAFALSLPCLPGTCKCERLSGHALDTPCTCYRKPSGATQQPWPWEREGEARCACSILALARDERAVAYWLAWRRMERWRIGDCEADAIPALGTRLLQMFTVAPVAVVTTGPEPERPYDWD